VIKTACKLFGVGDGGLKFLTDASSSIWGWGGLNRGVFYRMQKPPPGSRVFGVRVVLTDVSFTIWTGLDFILSSGPHVSRALASLLVSN
jgi:hypothetical protein